MKYTSIATTRAPAMQAYNVDVSGSMDWITASGETRIEVLNRVLPAHLFDQAERFTKPDGSIRARSHIFIGTFGDRATVLTDGFEPIDQLMARNQMPQFQAEAACTDFAAGLNLAVDTLESSAWLQETSPAPCFVGLSDGMFNNGDPHAAVARAQAVSTADGDGLVGFGYLGVSLDQFPASVRSFEGFQGPDGVDDPALRELIDLASVIPDSYLSRVGDLAPNIRPGSKFVLPCLNESYLQILLKVSDSTVAPG